MESVFVIITKLIASKNYFCKEVFCNNFGRDGILNFQGVTRTFHSTFSKGRAEGGQRVVSGKPCTR